MDHGFDWAIRQCKCQRKRCKCPHIQQGESRYYVSRPRALTGLSYIRTDHYHPDCRPEIRGNTLFFPPRQNNTIIQTRSNNNYRIVPSRSHS